jgi:hypothetical protein
MEINIELSKPQHSVLMSTRRYPLFLGGYGSGKSYILILDACFNALNVSGVNIHLYSPTFDQLRLNLFPRFIEMFTYFGIMMDYSKSTYSIRLQNGSYIYLRSLTVPERIIGYESYISYIDELDTLPMHKAEQCFNNIVARTRQKVNGERPGKVKVYSTPEGYNFLYHRYEKNRPSEEYYIIRSKTDDNPYMDKEYIQSLKDTFTPIQVKAYLNAEFVNMNSGNVYSYFDRDKHHTDRTIQKNDILYIGVDFNIGGCVGVVFVIDNIPMIVDEFLATDTFELAEHIRETYLSDHVVKVYPDSSGNSRKTSSRDTDIGILRRAGIKNIYVNNSNPLIKDRVNSVNRLFYNNQLKINTNTCPETTEALETHAYDEKTGKPLKYNNHPSVDDYNDAVGYFVHNKYPIVINKIRQSKKIQGI